MIFSYNWLKSFFAKKLPEPKKLAELLIMHSFEVEEVKKNGSDWSMDIDVLPNRASDCFSHLGIASECSAVTKLKMKNEKRKVAVKNLKLTSKDFIEVEAQNREDCPRYTAKVITNVKVGQSPKWLKKRLEVCGLQAINNIVDIANYVMLETGQPLHAFDLDKVKSVKSQIPMTKSQTNPNDQIPKTKIIVRKAKNGEKIKALDDKTYQLTKDILIIADANGPIGIAGIKGGDSAGIDKNTKNIVMEAANFNQKTIRLGSQKLKLRTDASLRFEQAIDPNLIDYAQERAAQLIIDIAKGEPAKGLSDFYPKKVLQKKIKLDLEYTEKLLGVKIPAQKIKSILKSLGFEIKEPKASAKKSIEAVIPSRRLDINLPEDLIEEIGRIYGYQKIAQISPKSGLIPQENNLDVFWQDIIRNRMKELGFSEVYNYSFISEKDKQAFGFDRGLAELENPISSEFQYLRPMLLINLLKNVKENSKYFDRFSLFEVGKVFQPEEKNMLSGIIFRKNPKAELFYEVKGACDSLLQQMGISDIWYDEHEPTAENSKLAFWQKGRCAEIKVGREEIGFLGEISDKILSQLNIKNAAAFEFDFNKLVQQAEDEQEYQPISRYPAAVRDVAVLVPLKTKVVDLLNVINSSGGKPARDVDLFDIYEGGELPEGKKNLAFHIIFQADDRTLNTDEIDKLMKKIISALEKFPGWEVRK